MIASKVEKIGRAHWVNTLWDTHNAANQVFLFGFTRKSVERRGVRERERMYATLRLSRKSIA